MTNEELWKYSKDNKSFLIAQKKSATKMCDSTIYISETFSKEGEAIKNNEVTAEMDFKSIKVKSVINTTGLLDSHNDVHIKGLWKKSISEVKSLYLLQEHKMTFSNIISDNVTASAKNLSWEKLGYNFLGNTEALIFDSVVDKDRNPYMFNQYLKGWVKNHSVGMRYVSMVLCINSDEKYYTEEKANYDKYYSEIVNKEQSDLKGMFWAVTEAKIVEGSAVPIGSNYATPTMTVIENKNIEPLENTQIIEPLQDTQQEKKNYFINISKQN